MGMHTEICAGLEAGRLATIIRRAIAHEPAPIARKVAEYLLPSFEHAVGDSWGSYPAEDAAKLRAEVERL